MGVRVLGIASEHDFFVQLPDFSPQPDEQAAALSRDAKGAPRAGMGYLTAAHQPTIAFHPQQRWIQGPRAELMAVLGQLFQQPFAPYLSRVGMVQDVDLPDPEADLAIGGGDHVRNSYTSIVNKRQRPTCITDVAAVC